MVAIYFDRGVKFLTCAVQLSRLEESLSPVVQRLGFMPGQGILFKDCNALLEVALRFLKAVLERCDDRFGAPKTSRKAEPVLVAGANFVAILQMLRGLFRLPSVEAKHYTLRAHAHFPVQIAGLVEAQRALEGGSTSRVVAYHAPQIHKVAKGAELIPHCADTSVHLDSFFTGFRGRFPVALVIRNPRLKRRVYVIFRCESLRFCEIAHLRFAVRQVLEQIALPFSIVARFLQTEPIITHRLPRCVHEHPEPTAQ